MKSQNKHMDKRTKNAGFNHRKSGNVKAKAPCKRHPKHEQSPGVCSICLNQRLSQLSCNPGSKAVRRTSSSSSSSYISSLSSSCSSPVVNYTCRMDSEARKSIRAFKNVGQNVLRKSKSMAFVLQRRREMQEADSNSMAAMVCVNMKRGFWSKLLPKKNSKSLMMHSKTTRERVPSLHH